MKFIKSGAAFAAASVVLAGGAAIAGNLVTNGGFETGDFSGWTANQASFPRYTEQNYVESGSWAAQIAGYSGNPDTLSQTLSTTAGTHYTVSFGVYQEGGGPTILLNVQWDGSTIFSQLNPAGDNAWWDFSVHAVGTGSDTLTFISANDPSYTYLDNVSVVGSASAPEPISWALMMIGLGGVGSALRGRRAVKVSAI